MKIAVTCAAGQVFQHFGHTPEFAIFETDGTSIVSETRLFCGESGHGALAGLLAEQHADVLICGGIGGGAINALKENGIQVVGGASGQVRDAAQAWLDGRLDVNADFLCHHHDGENHDCNDHSSSGCGGHCAH